jgi:hypothetical protein
MSDVAAIRCSFTALVDARRSLEAVLDHAVALPSVDAPLIAGGSRLTAVLDGIGGLANSVNQQARTNLDQLISALDLIALTFATTDEGLAQLALGTERNIETRPGS